MGLKLSVATAVVVSPFFKGGWKLSGLFIVQALQYFREACGYGMFAFQLRQIIEVCGYPPEIRKVIYTTNAIESVNMSLRKLSKNRGSFPSDEALTKLFYLALRNISQKWTMPIRDWKAALTRFTIQFGDRISVN
ncbi:transposase [Comamonas aquatica]|uniref:transposase n=1 Tax=Comamonas aquatica TaxID=225991 RepID=UPI003B84930A